MRKFPALHTISAIFKILSWLVAILTLVLIGVTLAGYLEILATAGLGKFGAAGVILLAGGFYALVLHAGGELIMVALAIEENTRHKD